MGIRGNLGNPQRNGMCGKHETTRITRKQVKPKNAAKMEYRLHKTTKCNDETDLKNNSTNHFEAFSLPQLAPARYKLKSSHLSQIRATSFGELNKTGLFFCVSHDSLHLTFALLFQKLQVFLKSNSLETSSSLLSLKLVKESKNKPDKKFQRLRRRGQRWF